MNRHSLRIATPADEAFLFDLFCRIRQNDPLQFLPEPARGQLLRVQFLGQQQTYLTTFTESGHRIVLWDGSPAGRIWIFRGGEEIRMVDISLLPEFQKQGIGTVLLRGLIEEAQRSGLPLRASASHTNAVSLHWMQSLGGTVVGTIADSYYELEWDTATSR